jgi:hypothetical protein
MVYVHGGCAEKIRAGLVHDAKGVNTAIEENGQVFFYFFIFGG